MRSLIKRIPKIVPVQPPPNTAVKNVQPAGQYVEKRTFMKQNEMVDRPKDTVKKDDPYLHSIRIKQMALKGDLERALHYFEQRLTEKRIVYDKAIFNTVIDVLGHAGRFRQAEQVYEEMRRRAVQPDDFTFSSLLLALTKNEDEELRKETAKIALRLYETAIGFGCKSVTVYNNMLTAMAKVATLPQLKKLFPPDMSDPRPDKYTYSIILRQLKREPFTEWRPYYEQLMKDSIPIDGPLMTALLLCVRLARPRPPEDFFHTFMSMISKKIKTEPFTRLTRPSHSLYMDVLRQHGAYHDAISHYDTLIKPHLDSRNVDQEIIRCLFRAMLRVGRGQAVLAEFERLRTHLYYRASARDMMAIVEACGLLKRGKCLVSYLQGYVVNGKVVPSVELLVEVGRVGGEEVREYFTNTLLPFVESKHPAVSLEYKNYISNRYGNQINY